MFRTILVPVDLNEPSSWPKALSAAAALARCFGATLALTTVVSDWQLMLEAEWSPIAYRRMLETTDARLGSLAATVEGVGEVAHHVETGGIYAGIIAVAERIGADLIVLASHRPAMKAYLLGANAARVVRHARCSVFVVRD